MADMYFLEVDPKISEKIVNFPQSQFKYTFCKEGGEEGYKHALTLL